MHGPKGSRDEVRARQLMFINDVIPYIELREAIKNGDVGRMEDLLHLLLFRFSGGGNPKYTILVLEVLQGLEREWTPDVKYTVFIFYFKASELIHVQELCASPRVAYQSRGQARYSSAY